LGVSVKSVINLTTLTKLLSSKAIKTTCDEGTNEWDCHLPSTDEMLRML